MTRKVDTEGEVSEPETLSPSDPPSSVSNLTVLFELPLWKLGIIRLESGSAKASLAVFSFLIILIVAATLAIFEAMPGAHPGASQLLGKMGDAVMLILGVMLGATGSKSEDK